MAHLTPFSQAGLAIPFPVVPGYTLQDYTRAEHRNRVKRKVNAFRERQIIIEVSETNFGVRSSLPLKRPPEAAPS